MLIKFNLLLAEHGIEPRDVVLLRHKDGRADKGRTPYDLWRDDKPAFELYQSIQNIKNRSKLTRPKYWASFVGTPNGQTMFTGLYRIKYIGLNKKDIPWPHTEGIDKVGSCDTYRLTAKPEFANLAGLLFIEWGGGERSWIQRADRQNKAIKELRSKFEEEVFPGFLNFTSPLSKIESLPAEWISILKANKGIYLLTCPKTKEQYVGKASGTEGFWHRWQNYIRTGHGNNVQLKSRNYSDYQVSILEVAGTAMSEAAVHDMETLWKRKLQSREMGLNRN